MAAGAPIAFEDLRSGHRVKITQRVKVGRQIWQTEVQGVVEKTERRRNGLHVQRSFDDRAYTDLVVLRKDGPANEETTIAFDEYTRVEPVESP